MKQCNIIWNPLSLLVYASHVKNTIFVLVTTWFCIFFSLLFVIMISVLQQKQLFTLTYFFHRGNKSLRKITKTGTLEESQDQAREF